MDPEQTGQSPTGVVTGQLNGQDFWGGTPLTYGGTGSTTKGAVVVDPTTGAYTYTPGADLATWGGTDTFSATVSNTSAYQLPGLVGEIQKVIHQVAQAVGLAQSDTTTKAVTVTIVINPSPDTVGTVGLPGEPVGAPILSADGKRAYQVSETSEQSGRGTTTVGIVNTVTGTAVGVPITLQGQRVGALLVSTDGTRIYQTVQEFDPTTETYTTTVAIINTATGALVGTPVVLDGAAGGLLQLSSDGTRAFQTSKVFDAATSKYTSTVAVIDTVSGGLVGTPLTAAGSPYSRRLFGIYYAPLQFSADGARAYLTTTTDDSGTSTIQHTTTVVLINTATATQIGAPIVLDGEPVGPLALSADGTRAFRVSLIHGIDYAPDTTLVAVFDATTGVLVDTPVTLTGYVAGGRSTSAPTTPVVQFSPDGSRAFLTVVNPDGGNETTKVVMIDSASGSLLGTPTVMSWEAFGSLQQSPNDPTRYYQVVQHPVSVDAPLGFTSVQVINSANGAPIGEPVVVDGLLGTVLEYNADGTRAFLISSTNLDTAPTSTKTFVAVINSVTGAQVGTSLTIAGKAAGNLAISKTGDRAALTTQIEVNTSDGPITQTVVALIDTANGGLYTLLVNGAPVGAVQLSDDGTRAYQTGARQLAIIDAVTGQLLGGGNFNQDQIVAAPQFNGNIGATPLYLSAFDATTLKTVVLVFNPNGGPVGGLTGSWDAASGNYFADPVFSADGTRAYVTTTVPVVPGGNTIMRVTEIDTATGKQIGTPVTISGESDTAPVLSADGSRLVITVKNQNGDTEVVTVKTAPVPSSLITV
ncbi:hypothetical protein ACTXG7_08855 [Mycolicibacterium sp. Dal123E01]|uniref:hypothetical protein n=1 Tax=Mycolicibacterium sp. Dal123E01 TaxID=3457578 RepID=UPI00403E640A